MAYHIKINIQRNLYIRPYLYFNISKFNIHRIFVIKNFLLHFCYHSFTINLLNFLFINPIRNHELFSFSLILIKKVDFIRYSKKD